MNNIKKAAAAIIAATMLVTLVGCGEQPVKETAQTATNITAYTVTSGDIANNGSYTGEIKEGGIAGVSAKVSAKVISINVDEGSYVNAGDVLAVLDSSDIQLSYNQALAAYNSAKASYDMTANSTTVQAETQARQAVSSAQIEHDNALASYNREKALYDGDTSLVAARNALNDANLNYSRMQQLFALGSVSQIELDAAKTAAENAQASVSSLEAAKQSTLEAAKTRYDNAVNNLKSAKETLNLTVNVTNEKSTSVAEANVASAKAALDIASHNLANTSITAPISGYIATKNLKNGQMTSPGVEIFSIVSTNSVEAEFNVTESVIPFVKVGTPAVVSVKSAGINDIEATVTSVNQTKNAQTGLYTVKVSIANSDNLLKVGMFADVKLTLETSENVVYIPLDAVLQADDTMYVYVTDGTTATKRELTLGISDGEYTEVTSGLSAGEQIVVKGKEYLSETNNLVNITQ